MNGHSQAFILGASSTIGRVLLERARAAYENVIGSFKQHPVPGCVEFDIEQDTLLDSRFGVKAGADVFLLAAATDPNWIFHHTEESERRFVFPLTRLAQGAVSAGARVVFFSSELVFDGLRGGYRESDTPSPTTVYGRQKVRLESLITGLAPRSLVVRTGALVTDRLDDNCIVRKTYETLHTSGTTLEPKSGAKAGARFAYHAQVSLTHVEDLIDVTLRLLGRDASGICHVAGAPVTRTELARQIVRASRFGAAWAFEEVSFDRIPYPEPRPRLSWLASDRLRAEEAAVLRGADQIVPPKVSRLDGVFDGR